MVTKLLGIRSEERKRQREDGNDIFIFISLFCLVGTNFGADNVVALFAVRNLGIRKKERERERSRERYYSEWSYSPRTKFTFSSRKLIHIPSPRASLTSSRADWKWRRVVKLVAKIQSKEAVTNSLQPQILISQNVKHQMYERSYLKFFNFWFSNKMVSFFDNVQNYIMNLSRRCKLSRWYFKWYRRKSNCNR